MKKQRQKMAEFNNKDLQNAVSFFLSTFGGEDGGVGLVKICMGLKAIEAQHEEGGINKESARQLIEFVTRTHKLLEHLTK